MTVDAASDRPPCGRAPRCFAAPSNPSARRAVRGSGPLFCKVRLTDRAASDRPPHAWGYGAHATSPTGLRACMRRAVRGGADQNAFSIHAKGVGFVAGASPESDRRYPETDVRIRAAGSAARPTDSAPVVARGIEARPCVLTGAGTWLRSRQITTSRSAVFAVRTGGLKDHVARLHIAEMTGNPAIFNIYRRAAMGGRGVQS